MSEAAIIKKKINKNQQILDFVGPTLLRQTQRSCPLSPEIQLLVAVCFFKNLVGYTIYVSLSRSLMEMASIYDLCILYN